MASHAASNYTTNGDLFYTTATGLVSQSILDCWQPHNQALHSPQDTHPEAQVLAEQVHQILATANANFKLVHLVPNLPTEAIIQCPICKLQQWVQCGRTCLNNHLTAGHKHAVLHTLNMQTFFCPKQANDLCPP